MTIFSKKKLFCSFTDAGKKFMAKVVWYETCFDDKNLRAKQNYLQKSGKILIFFIYSALIYIFHNCLLNYIS